MASEKLKCQFCALDFTSVYKIIPHLYFGHRKKISKYVREHQEVRLKCPAGCEFSHGVQVEKTAGPEIIFPTLSKVFLVLEDHMVKLHTQEQKLSVCPYCQKNLADLVYWEHLEEHMGSTATPSTPKSASTSTPKTPGTPSTPGTPVKTETPTKSVVEKSSPDKQLITPSATDISGSAVAVVKKEKSPCKDNELTNQENCIKTVDKPHQKNDLMTVVHRTVEYEASPDKDMNKGSECPQLDAQNISSLKIKEPKLKEDIKDVKTDVIKPVLKNKVSEQRKAEIKKELAEIEKKIKEKKEEERKHLMLKENSGVAKNNSNESLKVVTQPKVSVSEEMDSPRTSKDLDQVPECKLVASPTSINSDEKDIKIHEKLNLHDVKKIVNEKTSTDSNFTTKSSEVFSKFSSLNQSPLKTVDSNLASEKDKGEKLSKTLKKSPDKNVKDASGAENSNVTKAHDAEITSLESVNKKIEEDKSIPIEIASDALKDDNMQVDGLKLKFSPIKSNLTASEDKKSGEIEIKVASENSPHSSHVKGDKNRELSEVSEIKSIGQREKSSEPSCEKVKSREISGDKDKMNRNSGEKKKTKSVWSKDIAKDSEESCKTEFHDIKDTIHQDKSKEFSTVDRRDSNSRRSSGGELPVKQKPILTEEMERKIIYGNFKKKESREDKLIAVKREIEARFKEEEVRKKKILENKRKSEEKEREKLRIHEEKLRKEREKLKEERRKLHLVEKSAKEVDDVQPALDNCVDESESETPGEQIEDDNVEASISSSPIKSPSKSREKSPDQYQRIKMEIMKIDIEIEKKQAALHSDKKRKDVSRSPSPIEMLSPMKVPKVYTQTPTVKEPSKPHPSHDEPEEDLDDLEIMMRDFQEREAKERMAEVVITPNHTDSLSLLRDNYAPKAKSKSPSPPPLSTRPIPSGFDKDGHPIQTNPLSDLGEDSVLKKAANNAARGIMGPARNKIESLSLQLHCSVCKEEGPSISYASAYQLLSHVFLAHRKKIVSRSRKARGMTLACPEGCGFTTSSTDQGVSIDFFNSQLPLHLASLCDHIIGSHTGEDKVDNCQYCSLPLDHKQGWSWQHLANHRDSRRIYCKTCTNFPFKNEEHKCVGQADIGINSPSSHIRNTPSPAGAVSSTETLKSEKNNKSLEELAREVESGALKPEELCKQRNLGNVSQWICARCDQPHASLSQWMSHFRGHISSGQIKHPNHLRCFCCQWRPFRVEKGGEILALHSLVNHLTAEHSSPSWVDMDFDDEKAKLENIAKDYEKRLEREKEEKSINIPVLPCKCTDCSDIISESKTWKYHVLAHKFGEVFCSTCLKCVLGHQWNAHKVKCTTVKKNVANGRVEKYRGDTWLDIGGKKLKVFFEYDENEDLGRVTIAKCMVKGNLPMMGVGVNHDEAANILKEEVEDYFSTLKEQEDTVNNEMAIKEDRQALIDMFVELVKMDKENSNINFTIDICGEEYPVKTQLDYTRQGKVQVVAVVEIHGEKVAAFGTTRQESVDNLAIKVGRMDRKNMNKKVAKFCCVDCGSRFSKEPIFRMHQSIKCRV